MSTDKPRRQYHYVVRNGNDIIIRTFGCDYNAARDYAKRSEGVGLHYNLTVRKYLVNGGSQLGEPTGRYVDQDGGANNGPR